MWYYQIISDHIIRSYSKKLKLNFIWYKCDFLSGDTCGRPAGELHTKALKHLEHTSNNAIWDARFFLSTTLLESPQLLLLIKGKNKEGLHSWILRKYDTPRKDQSLTTNKGDQ